MFSCEFHQISKNTFFKEHLWATASISRKGRRLMQIEICIISKLTKKIIIIIIIIIIKKMFLHFLFFTCCAHPFFFFRFHFLQRGLIFHYIHTFIMFKHNEFVKHTWIHTSKTKKNMLILKFHSRIKCLHVFFSFFIRGWNFILAKTCKQ